MFASTLVPRLGLYSVPVLCCWISTSVLADEWSASETRTAELRSPGAQVEFERLSLESKELQLESEKLDLKRKEWELKAFKRSEFGRNLDEQRERNRAKTFSDRLRLASTFINGHNRPWTQAAFRTSMRQLQTSPEAAAVLQSSVPSLEAEEFVASSRFSQILNSDGSLKQPPPILVGNQDNSPLTSTQVAMEDAWIRTLELVGEDSTISYEHIAAMQNIVERWKRFAAPHYSRSDLLARRRGDEYLRSVTSLIKAVEDPDRREQLKGYSYGAGMAFQGGTVADLIHHVMSNNLSIHPGGRAHVILSELGRDMLRDLDTELQLANQRVEYYKVQNQQAGLDPYKYGAELPQRRDVPGPGSVRTSVERLEQSIRNGENRPDPPHFKVTAYQAP